MSADRCDYLCFAWGETDRPCAAIVSDRAAVRQFLIDQWLGEECEELDAAMARFDADSDDGDAWDGMDSIDWQFEIGGVRITKVFAIAAAPAAPAAEPVAHLRFRAAMHASPDGNVEAAEWLEVCEPTDIGDDQSPAFAVYDTPGATPAQSREPLTLTDEQIDDAVYAVCPDFDQWHEGPSLDDIRAIVRAVGIGSREPLTDERTELPPAYMLAKLQMVMPLFQEARDALTAITEAQRKLHGIRAELADRMDEAGTFSLDQWKAAHGIGSQP